MPKLLSILLLAIGFLGVLSLLFNIDKNNQVERFRVSDDNRWNSRWRKKQTPPPAVSLPRPSGTISRATR